MPIINSIAGVGNPSSWHWRLGMWQGGWNFLHPCVGKAPSIGADASGDLVGDGVSDADAEGMWLAILHPARHT